MTKPLLNYCLVTQNLASIIEDSAYDMDRYPDVSDISGEIIFTPNIANGKAYQLFDNEGKSYTVPVSRIQAKIINGVITHEEDTGIYLFAAGPGSNPDKITYSVEYRNLRSGELSFSLSPLKFEAIPGGEVDLTMATPVIGATPAGTTKGDKGDKGDPFLYEDFTPEQIDDLKGPLTLADLTPERLETIKGPKGDRGPGIHSVSVDGSDLVFTVDENGIVEISRVPLVEAANGIRDEISEDLTESKNAVTAAEGYAKQSASSASDSASSASESARYKDISLSAAERAEFAAEETIQQVEGDFATRNYVDGLSDRVYKLEPHSVDEVGETVWAHVTSRGERLPLGYSKDGRLDSHAQKIFQEDIVDTFDVSHSPVYAHLTTTPRGDILWGVRWDGTVEIPKLETSTGVGSGDSLATRLVPLAFTLPGGSSTTSGSKSLRIIREYAHFPGRVRVHVSNRHPVSGNAGSDVTLTGSTIGVGAESGEVSKAQVLFSANTVIPAGEEVVSRWVTISGSDGDGLAVSMAWSGDTVRLFKAGCWTNSDPTAYNNANTTGWAWNSDAPLYIWVEAEMPARVPVVMANGDSISVGSVTDNPVSDAWVAMYARKQHALPVFASWHGSSMPQWAPDTGQWGRLYPGVDVRPDAIVMALGQNDLNQDVDLNELKSRYNTVRDVYDVRFPGVPVYVGTVNASNKPAEKEVIRREFNTWLSSLPRGERGVLDFASVLDDPTGEFLLPEYTADELHPNTAGQTAMSGVVLKNPVTPLVPTGGQIATLGGTPKSSVVYDMSDFLAPGTTITAGWGRIMRDANVVTLSIQGLATDKSGVATLFTLPEGFRPINQIVFETVPYWSSETRESGRLTSGGGIQFRALSVGHGMNLSLTYLTDDPQPTS